VNAPTPQSQLPPDDPGRRLLGRAVIAVLCAAGAFMVVELPVKHFLGADAHAPWSNDPYDAVTSFAVFFVPLMTLVALIRVGLCRRSEPLPVSRALGILRSSRVVLATIGITAASDWLSVALQANRAAWDGLTPWLIALLALLTVVAAAAAVALRLAALRLPRRTEPQSPGPDWFTDLIAFAEMVSALLGPLARIAGATVRIVNRLVVASIRRYPIAAAAAGALAFGVLLALNTLLREGAGPALWIDVVVGSSGMFTFLVVAGEYVGLVRRGRPAVGVRRRAVDAAVIGAAAVPAALGFRESLWWVLGSSGGGPLRLAELLAVAALASACAVFAAETLLRVHPPSTA
jgi:hypothetical protein